MMAAGKSHRVGKLIGFLFLGVLWAQAQVPAAGPSVAGTVFDPSHSPIVGARVMAVPEGESSGPSVLTDGLGAFLLPLQPGRYTLTVQKDGFAEGSEALELAAAYRLRRDIQLQLSPVETTVDVNDSAGYVVPVTSTATRTARLLRDTPQSITVVTQSQIQDQMLLSIGDVVRYIPGITAHQGENNRDQVIIRGNSSTADFFVNGVRDDVRYYRDLYNLERVEALKGPNAMIFGRGGAGGVINRVLKEAGFAPLRGFTLQGGSFADRRFSTDLDQPLNNKVAIRLNGLYEGSDSFRQDVGLERYGIAPSLLIAPTETTKIVFNYEHFRDYRVADRGIPSFDGEPADTPISTFFGNPEESRVRAVVNLGSATIEHSVGRLNLRNTTLLADYDRGYQNFVPGAVTPDKTLVAITAYNDATARRNAFNQTDLVYSFNTGSIRHVLLAGTEFGLQLTNNFRNTGFFNNTSTSISVPYTDPTISTPVTFRQNATDADNHVETKVAATYVQDQVELSSRVQVIAGLRFDRFDLRFHNNRNGVDLSRVDSLVSPRLGIVFKPATPVSIYGSYTVSHLPGSGDQFSSLTTITEQLKPEKFQNYEVGIKWDTSRYLSLTTAVYLMDRTNTRAIDPNDPTRIIQTGATRTNGYELGAVGNLTRKWRVAGGYAYQNAYIRSATAAAPAGAQVAQVPHHSFSLWNNYQIVPRLGAGLGVVNRSDMFAAVDNKVTLPGYVRLDAAVFVSLTEKMRLQVNVENLFDKRYYVNADGNNNISPGFPRAVRAGIVARF